VGVGDRDEERILQKEHADNRTKHDQKFKARNHHPEKRVYTHFTCATDTSNIRRVFDIVKVIIVRTHLIEVGLMDSNQEFDDKLHDYDSDDQKDDVESSQQG